MDATRGGGAEAIFVPALFHTGCESQCVWASVVNCTSPVPSVRTFQSV